MPANLNALIRYKTIDRCLSNPYREWTIGDLIEACSHALEENRGIYTGVSERTIREDIRVMRSDILGFNAPIAQKEGNYFYEDPGYSIFNVSITNSGLLERVLKFILELRSEIDHPDMEEIISQISKLLPEPPVSKKALSAEDDYRESVSFLKKSPPSAPSLEFPEELYSNLQESQEQDFQWPGSGNGLKWSRILDLIK